jgi:hypothetical protein
MVNRATAKTRKHARVRRIIKPIHSDMDEKAEIEVLEADDLYRELRINNRLHDEYGREVRLKENAEVEVVIEAEPEQTDPISAVDGNKVRHGLSVVRQHRESARRS